MPDNILKEEKIVEKLQYSSFNNLSEVAERFDCEIEYGHFVKEKNFEIAENIKENIIMNFNDRTSHQNEYVICERLISPILTLISQRNNLILWSHCKYDVKVDDELEFTGSPDYLWGIPIVRGGWNFSKTVACLGEAKKDKFEEGWGQVGAEMIATQYYNNNFELPVFGLVSNGKKWEFGKLVKKTFIIDEIGNEMPVKIENVLDSLNWFLGEVRKNVDILEEVIKKEKMLKKSIK